MRECGDQHTWDAAVVGMLCLLALAPVDSIAQQGKPKAPPQLPPQASEQAKQKVAEHTAPTVSLTVPAGGALYTAPATVSLEATAAASSSGRSIAQVDFFAGTTLIGTAITSPYQFNWSNVAAGSYSLTAKATDNLGVASTSAPVAIIVNAPPTVGLSGPANNALFTAPAAITLTADAADTDGSVTQVEFFQGTTLITTVTGAPFTASLSGVAAGSYTYSARATDDRGAVATSASVSVRVNAPPSASLISPAANATFTAPATVPLSAQALDSDGTIARVEFYNGADLIGTLTEQPFSTNWLLVPAGSYTLTARVTDDLGATTVSEAVAVTVTQALAQIYYIHTDHLNTPRAIYDQQQRLVWRWDNLDPFGGNVPDENPSGLGTFTCNLRLPGQYFDRETNLHYNYFRDYDPSIGRYAESDPIGLKAGLNTYAYVGGNPLSGDDPLGLAKFCCRPLNAWRLKRHCYLVADDGTSYGLYPGTRAGVRVGIPERDDPRDRGGDCFDCPELDCGPDQGSCLRRASRSYPVGAYRELGPNSNTYAGSLARQCCKGGVPAGVQDAPGIDSSPPTLNIPPR